MLEYVLVVYFDDQFNNGQYVGHFESCAHAQTYLEQHHKEYGKRKWDKCLFEKYILLPPQLIKKYPELGGKK